VVVSSLLLNICLLFLFGAGSGRRPALFTLRAFQVSDLLALFLGLFFELENLFLLFIILAVLLFLVSIALLLEIAQESLVLKKGVVRIDSLLALGLSWGELLGGIPPKRLLREDARVERNVGSCAVCFAGTTNFVRPIAQHDSLIVAD
jgi:hypothetical protein